MCTKWLRKTKLQFSALTQRQGINNSQKKITVVANNTYLFSPRYKVFKEKFYVLSNSDEHHLARPIQK